ncbi:MAG: hypothetical protein JWM05_3791, partial [Acidimicrobiales bacterium]|nr:hypothetical protein [Acidimicrobiales bacterium]
AVRRVAPIPERRALQRLFAGAAALHIAEATYAARGARRAGLAPGPWAAQTLVVGFPSLLQLRRAAAAG